MKLPNTKQTSYFLFIVLISLAIGGMSGCQWGDIIEVNTPSDVQGAHNLPPKMTVNEAKHEYQQAVRDLDEWKRKIEQGSEVVGTLDQATMGFLDGVGPELMGLPVLGPLAPVLAAAGGLLIRRPGDKSQAELSKEKEDSYNAGQKAAQEAIKALSSN